MKIYKLEVWSFSVVLALIIAAISIHAVTEKKQVIKKISTTHKVVAITIDDGPHYQTTPVVLSILKEKNVKATFFVLGTNVDKHPEIFAQTVIDGHEIGIHGYSHRLMTRMSQQAYENEMDTCQALISKYAPKPSLFRPPGGAYNDNILLAAHKRGYRTILWTIDPGDWRVPPVNYIINHVLENIQTGSIILLHDGQYPLTTVKALPIIIDKLREKGYIFTTVSELLTYEDK